MAPAATGSVLDVAPFPTTLRWHGVIAGAVLRAIRRRLGLHQDQLAELLGVDFDAYRSWETGRRPLHRIPVYRFHALSRQLRCLGATGQQVSYLSWAVDADLLLLEILAGLPIDFVDSQINELIAWAGTGSPPRALLNKHPETDRPRLSVADRNTVLSKISYVLDGSGA